MNNRPRDTDLGAFNGSVKFYNHQKGYGFLFIEDGRECFFHFTGIARGQNANEVTKDAEVSFRLWKQNGEDVKGNGLKATEVRVTRLEN